MAPQPDQIIAGYQATVAAVRDRLAQLATLAWGGLGSYRDADIERLVALLVPRVQAGQLQVANLTAAYIAAAAATIAVTVNREAIVSARGVPAEQVYRRPANQLYFSLAQGVAFDVARAVALTRLVSLVTTDLQMAKVRQSDASLKHVGARYYRRVLTGGGNCAKCVIASTRRYKVGTLLPVHPGCVPAGSVVSVPSDHTGERAAFAWGEVQAVTRREFEGELVEFITAGGDQVRVTPNHPVLTDRGWIPGDLLREGDTVFGGMSGQGMAAGRPQVDQRPTLIEDVFDTARMAFPLVRVPLATEDFHADAANGEVEIVYTNGHFPAVGNAHAVQVPGELGLVAAHRRGYALDGGGALGAFLPARVATSGGSIRGGNLSLPGVDVHLGSAELSGCAAGSRFDAPAEKFSFENSAVYAERGMDLKRRLAGLVQGDRIVELRRIGWAGHVYNLQTRDGWYQSNNRIVSNCDCGVAAIRDSDPPLVLDRKLLDSTHEQVGAFADIENDSAQGYQDLIVTHEHGEIGPVLAWRNQNFRGPADL